MTDPLPVQVVPIANLKPHARNYQGHPDDQIEHLMASIREHGLYRNIVVARDGTVLAGHGVLQAAQQLGLTELPVVRVGVDPDSLTALKILTGDNEISHLAERDDRLLTELLREINDAVDLGGLLGTGYDQASLADLVASVTPASPVAPTEFPTYDEDIETQYECPSCHYAWSGKPRPDAP